MARDVTAVSDDAVVDDAPAEAEFDEAPDKVAATAAG
jgi:hypothetical protein